ncbi:TPA: hypothetical protein ACNMTN_005543 [Klebsiella pneumoniae]
MDLFKANLIDVKTGDFNNLVFESTKYDMGLGKEVPCSVQVMISKEHEFLIPEYKKFINSEVTFPVRILVTKKQSIMRITGSDGLPLSLG